MTGSMQYDAIIIGAGHNGLVAAGYLARAGLKVAVFEARPLVGGAAVTEEIFPGFKFSSLSYVNSLFRPEIIRDLRLKDFGLEMLPRNPSSFSPFPNHQHLFLGPDKAATCREIAKFSLKDAENYPRYESMLARLGELLEPLMLKTPLTPGKSSSRDYLDYLRFAVKKRGQLKKDWPLLTRLLTGSAADMLNHWFESEELKVTLATDAVIGANASPRTPGTSYVLFHHVMGECNGVRGVWGFVRGGMGGLSNSIARSCQALGVEICTSHPVERILVRGGQAAGVVARGKEFGARVVVSNATPRITFERLLAPQELPEEFLSNIRLISYDSASLKINLALSQLPDFLACPGKTLGPQHMGTIHICPDLQYIEEAYADSVAGRPSSHPLLECTIPTSADDTLAPPGRHIMNIFCQYAPYHLKTGTGWDGQKEAFADRVIDLLAQYAPNVRNAVLHRQVLSPLDMEREYHLTGGNLFHGRLSLDQIFHMRPVPGFADYTTPIAGLYVCGSGAHPGGGVMGTPGWNAARAVLKSL